MCSSAARHESGPFTRPSATARLSAITGESSLQKHVVELQDFFPVGCVPGLRNAMAGGDAGLEVELRDLFSCSGTLEMDQAARDHFLIPRCAVLVLQQQNFTIEIDPGRKARCLQ